MVGTACPFCSVMVSDGIKETGREEQMQTQDVAQLVAAAMNDEQQKRFALGRWRWLALLFNGLVSFLALLLPVGVIWLLDRVGLGGGARGLGALVGKADLFE